MVTLGFTAAPASAVSITNGSFEFGTNPPAGTFRTLGSGNTDIAGWTVGGGGVDWINTYWTASDGVRSLDLSGNAAGSVEQTITGLTIGSTYQISFDMAGNNDGGDVIKDLIAATIGSVNFSFDVTGTSNTNMGWVAKSFVFTAIATSQLLKFTSAEANAYGAALDNVSISAVPLPAALPLFGAGLAALGLAGLRRRRRQAGPA
jgi:choice-of-anchor C domain-containing protein